MKTLCRMTALSLVAALAACGGGGGGAGATLTPQLVPASSKTANVTFTIAVPTASGAKARHRPQYVSASTKSASFAVNAGTPTTVNCATVCTGTVSAAVGSDTFAVNLYDATNGTGNVLSTGSTTQTIIAGQANSVNVTFNGVVATLAVALNSAYITSGYTQSFPVTVNALDADGNIIIGPGNYVSAAGAPETVTLSDSDSSGATHLSTTSLTQPTSGITLSYNGSAAVASLNVSASASGVSTASAAMPVKHLYLFVADQSADKVTEYALPAGSLVATISNVGSTSNGPQNLGFDTSGNLFVPVHSSAEVLEYAPPYTGAPIAITNGLVAPRAVALDAAGNLYVSNQGTASVLKYAPPLSAASSATATITNSLSPNPFGLGFDPSGNLYVSDFSHNAVYMYAPPLSSGSTAGFAITSGVSSPQGIAFDSSGDLFVTNFVIPTGTVTEYAPPLSSSSAPVATISGLSDPQGVVIDAFGNLFVANASSNVVQEYAPPYTGSPVLTISGFASPDGVALLLQ